MMTVDTKTDTKTDMGTDTDTARTMRAVVNRAGGPIDGPESLMDARVPVPRGPNGHDLLVRVEAVSVNPVEVKVRASHRGSRDGILGYDASGTVERVGEEVTLFRPGDEVFYAGDITRPGSNATLQLVDERIVGHRPRRLDATDAAALPLTGLTAWEALFDKLRLTRESTGTLLVVGAAGGVGSMLIQLATRLTGMRVIALASRPESADWVRRMGADHVVDYRDPGCAKRIQALAPGGVDAVFSAWSKGNIGLYAKVMRPFGRIAAIDDEWHLDWYVLKDKALSWEWEFMFARSKHHAADMVRQHDILEQIAHMIDAGDLVSTVTTRFEGIDAAHLRRAHALVETGHGIGKVVVGC